MDIMDRMDGMDREGGPLSTPSMSSILSMASIRLVPGRKLVVPESVECAAVFVPPPGSFRQAYGVSA